MIVAIDETIECDVVLSASRLYFSKSLISVTGSLIKEGKHITNIHKMMDANIHDTIKFEKKKE